MRLMTKFLWKSRVPTGVPRTVTPSSWTKEMSCREPNGGPMDRPDGCHIVVLILSPHLTDFLVETMKPLEVPSAMIVVSALSRSLLVPTRSPSSWSHLWTSRVGTVSATVRMADRRAIAKRRLDNVSPR